MAETTFTFRVDEDLKTAFANAAKAQDRSAAQLLRVLMREAVQETTDSRDHDAWFRGEVERALAESEDSSVELIADHDVKAVWDRKRAEILCRSDSRAR